MESIKSQSYKKYVIDKVQEFNSNDKETIILFSDAFYPIVDGVVNVVNNSAKTLAKKYNVVVCVSSSQNDMVEIKEEYLVLCSKSTFLKQLNYSIAKPGNDKFFNEQLNKLQKVSFVHIHSPFYIGKYGLSWAKKNKYPVYATFHSLYKKDFLQESKSPLIASILLEWIMKVFNNVDGVFTMSEKCKETLLSYKCKNKNIWLIPNGSEAVKKIPDRVSYEIKQQYSIKDKIPTLLFVGRLVKQKNIDFIAKVLYELKFTEHFNFQMIFVGESKYREKYTKKIEKLGLKDNVIFTGQVVQREQLLSFYKISDLFIFPSTYDTFGLVKVEATSYDLPTIFLEDTVVSCGVVDKVNGYIGKNNPLLFAKKIIEALDDKENKDNIIKNAKKSFVFSWDDVTNQMLNEIKSLQNKM